VVEIELPKQLPALSTARRAIRGIVTSQDRRDCSSGLAIHFSRAVLLAILVALGLALSTAAGAQTVTKEFASFNSWWLHPSGGTLGVFYDGSKIKIDRNGDGTANSSFDVPSGPNALPIGEVGLRLSPSREILYAFGGVCQTLGTKVYFYRVPPAPSTDPLDAIRTGYCIPKGILDQPGFYDTGLCE
jgi:hypothetical protein